MYAIYFKLCCLILKSGIRFQASMDFVVDFHESFMFAGNSPIGCQVQLQTYLWFCLKCSYAGYGPKGFHSRHVSDAIKVKNPSHFLGHQVSRLSASIPLTHFQPDFSVNFWSFSCCLYYLVFQSYFMVLKCDFLEQRFLTYILDGHTGC